MFVLANEVGVRFFSSSTPLLPFQICFPLLLPPFPHSLFAQTFPRIYLFFLSLYLSSFLSESYSILYKNVLSVSPKDYMSQILFRVLIDHMATPSAWKDVLISSTMPSLFPISIASQPYEHEILACYRIQDYNWWLTNLHTKFVSPWQIPYIKLHKHPTDGLGSFVPFFSTLIIEFTSLIIQSLPASLILIPHLINWKILVVLWVEYFFFFRTPSLSLTLWPKSQSHLIGLLCINCTCWSHFWFSYSLKILPQEIPTSWFFCLEHSSIRCLSLSSGDCQNFISQRCFSSFILFCKCHPKMNSYLF